jgi:chloride intracellular channel protein 2
MDDGGMNNHHHNHQGEGADTKEIELYVRAGKNGEALGGCPVCQRFFMVLLTKAEFNRDMSLVVTTVNAARPPPELTGGASRLPVLRYGKDVISDPDEIDKYIDSVFHEPPMTYDNASAAKACRDVFSKFSFYVKDVARSHEPLLAELYKLNAYLEESPFRFLCRNDPDNLDCMMLPKLQHIRVVSKALKGFDIPAQLTGLWRYLATAYDTPAFRNSCPSDQEIVEHWQSKKECPSLDKQSAHYYSTEAPARYSYDVPPGIEARR